MRKIVVSLVMVALLFAITAPMAAGAEMMINAKITAVNTQPDKNGNEYTRLIVESSQKEINGVKYTSGIPAMCFGQLNEPAKAFKPGDTLKAIVDSRKYQGRDSYTVLKILP